MPTAIILQFVTTFGVWVFAESVGLSGVLTTVCHAITVAQTACNHARTHAGADLPANAP